MITVFNGHDYQFVFNEWFEPGFSVKIRAPEKLVQGEKESESTDKLLIEEEHVDWTAEIQLRIKYSKVLTYVSHKQH